MCTVTYIPLAGKTLITHNRDEKSRRARALAPAHYSIRGRSLLFPRDGQAGGSWVALEEGGGAAVLLNGAFEPHLQQPPYRRSRGLIFLDIISANGDPVENFKAEDLSGIEPFTLLLFGPGKVGECRWDGEKKYFQQKDPSLAHTWASVTLYDLPVRQKREAWFRHWLAEHPSPEMDDIIQFHLHAGEGDPHNDLRINRAGQLLTVSITALELGPAKSVIRYLDLLDQQVFRQEQPLHPELVIKK